MTRYPVVYAEDEEDDVFLVGHAFKQAGIVNPLISVPDGETALQYLSGEGKYSNRSLHPFPALLLLDINMPMVSGLDVLRWVRAQPTLCGLPTLILSSSNQALDIRQAYELGANGYLVKPSSLEKLLVMVRAIRDFWLIQNQQPPVVEFERVKTGPEPIVLPDP